MAQTSWESLLGRRNFLTRLGIVASVFGVAAAKPSLAAAQPAPGPVPMPAEPDDAWHPSRHDQDAWYDQIPGQHRFAFDTSSPDGMNWGLHFAGNYFTANENGYGLKDSDLAVIIIARHKSTTFAYNNAMWAKYGKYFSDQSEYVDPKTKQPPAANPYLTSEGTELAPLDAAVKKGIHFAVCSMSTRATAGRIASGTNQKVDDVVKEITSNLVPNAHMVPAGIVAVNRAQEHGYSISTVS